jgi:hypothetical protein
MMVASGRQTGTDGHRDSDPQCSVPALRLAAAAACLQLASAAPCKSESRNNPGLEFDDDLISGT